MSWRLLQHGTVILQNHFLWSFVELRSPVIVSVDFNISTRKQDKLMILYIWQYHNETLCRLQSQCNADIGSFIIFQPHVHP